MKNRLLFINVLTFVLALTGCGGNTKKAFVNNFNEKNFPDGLKLLEAHRQTLLNELHREFRADRLSGLSGVQNAKGKFDMRIIFR